MLNLGIIGHPLGHTLSPIMHKAAMKHLGLDGDYIILDTPPEDLIERIKYLKVNNFQGFNVTIPHKVWITPLLNEVDDYANIAGAVNTVVIGKDKSLKGYNTDIYGFTYAIPQNIRENLTGKKAVVFGVGGAARAVAIGLADIGIAEIIFYARNIDKAEELKASINANMPNINVKIEEYQDEPVAKDASIIVNTTPLGMKGINEDSSPMTQDEISTLADDTVIYDLVYKPKITNLLKFAKERELTIIEGLEMLVLQGAKSFEIWTGLQAPVDVMRGAVLKSNNGK